VSIHVITRVRDATWLYGQRLVEIVYNASAFSIIFYTVILIMLLVVGLAVTDNIIHIPVFHPNIPVYSGS
jgi:hypothetical protein